MKVEVISKDGEEVRLLATADADEMERAFTDGLDAFILQYNLNTLKGESAYDKIVNTLPQEEADQVIYSSVVNSLFLLLYLNTVKLLWLRMISLQKKFLHLVSLSLSS